MRLPNLTKVHGGRARLAPLIVPGPWVYSCDPEPRLGDDTRHSSFDCMSILDQSILDDLRELDRGGDGGFLAQIIGVFERQAGGIGSDMKAAVSACDRTKLAALAHKLKGSARTVGCAELGDFCERLERDTRAGDIANLPTRLDEVLSAMERAIDALSQQV